MNLLFPRHVNCLVCGDPRRASMEDGLCEKCRAELENERVPAGSCEKCLSYVPKHQPCPFCAGGGMDGLDAIYAPYRYLSAARALVLSMKFGGTDDAAPLLIRAMADALPRRDFDALIPVPLHRVRERERGVNQAQVLADGLSLRTGVPVLPLALERVRATKPQSKLEHQARGSNVRDAFRVREDAQQGLSGGRFLLVDDVRTTGNTARECAKALKKGGAESVSLCVACVVWKGRGD